jgi:hypothetical protein
MFILAIAYLALAYFYWRFSASDPETLIPRNRFPVGFSVEAVDCTSEYRN